MISIRNCVFETNSSSTHSLNICTQEEWDNWVSGKLLYNEYDEKFTDKVSNNEDKDYLTFDSYWDDEYLETYKVCYTSKSGDKIVIFGKYGYDG